MRTNQKSLVDGLWFIGGGCCLLLSFYESKCCCFVLVSYLPYLRGVFHGFVFGTFISESSFELRVTLFRSFMFVMEKWRKLFEMMYRIFIILIIFVFK